MDYCLNILCNVLWTIVLVCCAMFYGLLLNILWYVLWTIVLSFSYLMLSCLSFLPITVSIDNKWNNFDFFSNFSLIRFGHPYRRLLPYLVNIIMEAFHGDILCVYNLSCYYKCRNRLSYTICVSHLSIYRHGVICIPVFIFLNELSLAVQLSMLMLYKLDISIIA